VRLAELERYRELVNQRDDLTVEMATLYNQTGQSARALSILSARRFHPWEGGEGLVSRQYVTAHLLLGRAALDAGDPRAASQHFERSKAYPHTFGEGRHALQQETDSEYFSGIAMSMLGNQEDAEAMWRSAAAAKPGVSSFAYYSALSHRKLGDEAKAVTALNALREAATEQMDAEVKIDYFATSLPNLLLFDDDLNTRNKAECLFVLGLAQLGLGNETEAVTNLRKALEIDRNHLWARVEIEHIIAQEDERARRW
jgi:tetratricopeptide (TPR) repeat protein